MTAYQVRWADWQGTHYATGQLVSHNVEPHAKTCVRDRDGRLQIGWLVATVTTEN